MTDCDPGGDIFQSPMTDRDFIHGNLELTGVTHVVYISHCEGGSRTLRPYIVRLQKSSIHTVASLLTD